MEYNDKNIFDIVIIGAGASGLSAAIAAGRAGARVLIIEHAREAARKLLMTGNGRCNLGNRYMDVECFPAADRSFVADVISRFGTDETLKFSESLGVMTVEKNGYIYPRNMQAAAVRAALLSETKRQGVRLRVQTDIRKIRALRSGGDLDDKSIPPAADEKRFRIDLADEIIYSRSCILAAGGASYPNTGSDGSGYTYAESLGHSIKKPLPALVPLLSDAGWLKDAAGVRARGRVRLRTDDVEINSLICDEGEIQLSARGISGIPVFQISAAAAEALDEGEDVEAVIDLFPEYPKDKLSEILAARADGLKGSASFAEILSGMIHTKLAALVVRECRLSGRPSGDRSVRRRQIHCLAAFCKEICVSITGTEGFAKAQVSRGGVPTDEINAGDMQSRLVPGLYFAGEIMDVDGICGGYNLHWAWATGYIAGISAAIGGQL